MRHPGIDEQRLVGVGGCVAQELALGRETDRSRGATETQRKGKGKMPARWRREGRLMGEREGGLSGEWWW